MINEIIRDNNSFLKFIKYASQFYKAKYYNFDNVLYLYELCPNGKAFATYEDWNNIGRRIIKDEHGFRITGENNWRYVVFDLSQTWGVPINFQKFDKTKTTAIINRLINNYDLESVNILSQDRAAFFDIIYEISNKNIEKKNYGFTEKEKNFVSVVTSLLVLNKCNYYINDLLSDDLLSSLDKGNIGYLLDTSYYFYKTLMFEVKDLEQTLEPLQVIEKEVKEEKVKAQEIPTTFEEQQEELKQVTESKDYVYMQPTLFNMESEEDKELINVLKRGNNFEKGDETIYRIMTTISDKNEAIKELKDSFGTGGYSHTYLNGEDGYIDYDSKGIRFRNYENNNEKLFNWNKVYDTYSNMIANREYPELSELERLENLEHNKDEILNNEFGLKNLDDTVELLTKINDEVNYDSISQLLDSAVEDNRYVENYYETLEDIQNTNLILRYLREQDKTIDSIIKGEDIKENIVENELEFPEIPEPIPSFLEEPPKEEKQVDVSKYIGKEYVIKAEDIEYMVSNDEDEEPEKFDIVYKFLEVDESNPEFGLVEDMNTNEIIEEDLDTIIKSIDSREKAKNDYIDYTARLYIDMLYHPDDMKVDIDKFELNVERDIQEFCLKEHYKYDEIKDEYDVAVLNMAQIRDGLGKIYTINDVKSTDDGNFIGNYKLTNREYENLFNDALDKHIDFVEGLDIEPEEYYDEYDYDNEYEDNSDYEMEEEIQAPIVNNQNTEKEQMSLFEPREQELANKICDIFNSFDTKYKDTFKIDDVELAVWDHIKSNKRNLSITLKSSLINSNITDRENSFTYFNEDKTDEEKLNNGLLNNAFIQSLYKDKDFSISFTPDTIHIFWNNFDSKQFDLNIPNDKVVNEEIEETPKEPAYRVVEQTVIPTGNGVTLSDKKYTYYDNDGNVIENYEQEESKVKDGTPKENYHIDKDFYYGTDKVKYRHNVEAIKLLREIEREGRNANKEEKDILANYTGWGGISAAFNQDRQDWTSEYNELRNLLINGEDESEYLKARESTLTSFYTPRNVVKTIWNVVEKLGFKTGNILEPSMGIGNFFGNMPESLNNSKLYGIELDNISGRISKQLYPNANIEINGYEDTNYQDNFFDLAISNIPFGKVPVYDKRYKNNNFLIHDYYFEKTLDKVRAGGLIAFVTSTATLDKKDNRIRKYIAQRADLVGAFRLPNNTFTDIAGTKVSTDVIILKKKDKLDLNAEPSWLYTDENENGVPINNYYLEHPEMMLGEMVFDKSMYGGEDNTSLHPFENTDLNDLLEGVVDNFESNIYEQIELEDERKREELIPALPNVKNNAYAIINNTLYQRNDSVMIPLDNQESKTCERIKGLIGIRDDLKQVFDIQLRDGTDEELEIAQRKLREEYDLFVKKYGFINSSANSKAFEDDPDCYLLSSIEDEYKENNQTLYRKGVVFYKRTIRKPFEVINAENPIEALTVSLNERGYVDLSYISDLVNMEKEQVIDELDGLIYKEPNISRDRQEDIWVTSAEYLSGNVREKLQQAELLNEDGSLDKNIEALKSVQPEELKADDIDISLGAVWIPPEIIKRFCVDLVGISWRYEDKLVVDYVPETNMWLLQRNGVRFDYGNVKNTKTWGTSRADALTLIKTSLNLKNISIFDKDDDGKSIFNPKETAIAREKQNEIKEEFKNWVNRNEYVKEQLVELYNKRFNSIRLREYDGSDLEFKGMSTNINLREHQRNAVARILFGGNTLLAHTVGAGKTFEMATASMELKRLGIANKPMFVVPNHLTEQWGQEFLRLYPNANILVATKKDFQKENRKKLMARISTGEWDAVIIGHSSFGKIPVSKELQISHIQEEIKYISMAVDRLKAEHEGRLSVKKMEAMQKSLSKNLQKLLDDDNKDEGVTFEELGVDYLFVDEAHEFKNLALFSKMNNVSGVSSVASQKASDLYMKIQYLDSLNPGKSVVFATGTPVSNSMAELYTMQKYLQYNTLRQMGLDYFDSWASIFGQTVTTLELSPDGGGFRNKTRFAKFNNLPELLTLFKNVADVQTAQTLKLPVPKLKFNRYEIVSAPKSEELGHYIEELVERSELIKGGAVQPYEDNMLKVTNDGRKAALDLRLIDENMPDLPDSKVNIAVKNIAKIYEDTKDNKSTQLVFCDLSTPKADGSFNVYDDIRKKLIDNGVSEDEIAFIHDADNEQKKAVLFEDMRNGKVRILMGSTAKMGAGMNVQNKLIALHHLDCPWRPSDIEQREGRILRQGNENEEVQIFRYVTEGSFDGYSYQLVETKANFINQIMTSSAGTRSMEDVDDSALSYAEVKAIATGNPLIKEKFQVETDLKQLSTLKSRYESSKREMEDDVTVRYPRQLKEHKNNLQLIENDLTKVTDTSGTNFSIEIMGKTYTERSEAGDNFLKLNAILKTEERVLGHFSGFEIVGSRDDLMHLTHYYLKGDYKYPIDISGSSLGNIIKIENVLKGIENRRDVEVENINKVQKQLEETMEEMQKPFSREEELKELLIKKNKIYKELGIDEDEEQIICETEENSKQFDMDL